MTRKKKVEIVEMPDGKTAKLGDLVSYYRNGWRLGYLEEIAGKLLWIKPWAPAGKVHRRISVGIEEVKSPN